MRKGSKRAPQKGARKANPYSPKGKPKGRVPRRLKKSTYTGSLEEFKAKYKRLKKYYKKK